MFPSGPVSTDKIHCYLGCRDESNVTRDKKDWVTIPTVITLRFETKYPLVTELICLRRK